MTREQVSLVQQSFARVAPIAPQAAALFYDRLFAIAPDVKPLFKRDMRQQGEMLMTALSAVVDGLGQLDQVVPAAQELAKRHVRYGVKREHYVVVGSALLWTLAQGLGPAFTDDVSAAWVEAYGVLSAAMIAAAYGDGQVLP
jgi:hemoglobin-like flavoprotein